MPYVSIARILRIFGNLLAFGGLGVMAYLALTRGNEDTLHQLRPILMIAVLVGACLTIGSMFVQHFQRLKDASNYAAERTRERIEKEEEQRAEAEKKAAAAQRLASTTPSDTGSQGGQAPGGAVS